MAGLTIVRLVQVVLAVTEIGGWCTAAFFGFRWLSNPTGPDEPVTFLALLIGTTFVDLVRRRLPQPMPPDPSHKLDELSAKVEALIKAAARGDLSVAQLNDQLKVLVEDSSFQADDPLRFRLCPKCGHSELDRELTWDRHHGMDLGSIRCGKCDWRISGMLVDQDRQSYVARFPGIRQHYH